MEIVYTRCCGLDVHKRSVVACLLVPGPEGTPTKEIRTFGTMTHDLLALSDWLRAAACTHVAMESTGVFWKPIYNLLEGQFELLVVNAQHIKAVPGRKTDVRDAEWIADLLRHGLLRPSFIPARPQRELRELTRYRTTLVNERANEVNRLQKVLEGEAPTSSWPQSPPTSWASPGTTSWRRWWVGAAMPRRWRSWHVGGCGRRSPSSSRRSRGSSARISAS